MDNEVVVGILDCEVTMNTMDWGQCSGSRSVHVEHVRFGTSSCSIILVVLDYVIKLTFIAQIISIWVIDDDSSIMGNIIIIILFIIVIWSSTDVMESSTTSSTTTSSTTAATYNNTVLFVSMVT